jgi:hypothetical protein
VTRGPAIAQVDRYYFIDTNADSLIDALTTSGPWLRVIIRSVTEFVDDVAAILSHRYDLGADYWTTPDKRILKGSPFNLVESVSYLLELGLLPDEPVLTEAIARIFSCQLDDGRFRTYPGGTPLPCQTSFVASVLCQAGLATNPRVEKTLAYLLGWRWDDSGWRCTSFPYGKGLETNHSNPHPTLLALDALRYQPDLTAGQALDGAVEFLLSHWDSRLPIGPCHYGIGTLFMTPEFPFRTYNLFHWVYVLSFYAHARTDSRYRAALATLQAQTVDGQIVVRRVVPKLAKLKFCAKNQPSALATRRYRELLANLD